MDAPPAQSIVRFLRRVFPRFLPRPIQTCSQGFRILRADMSSATERPKPNSPAATRVSGSNSDGPPSNATSTAYNVSVDARAKRLCRERKEMKLMYLCAAYHDAR